MKQTLTEDLQKIFKQHGCKGYAYAVDQTEGTEVGYGAWYPKGTEEVLIKKLQIIISDIKSSLK